MFLESKSTPRVFAAPSIYLNWIKRFCSLEYPLTTLGVDMTYKGRPYHVTT